jgi:serine/threonine-protein kinase
MSFDPDATPAGTDSGDEPARREDDAPRALPPSGPPPPPPFTEPPSREYQRAPYGGANDQRNQGYPGGQQPGHGYSDPGYPGQGSPERGRQGPPPGYGPPPDQR